MFTPEIIPATMLYRSFLLEAALKEIGKAGFEHAEITVAGTFSPHLLNLADMTEREMDEKAEMVQGSGVCIHALNIGAGYAGAENERVLRLHLNAFRMAKRLGAKIVTLGCGAIASGTGTDEGLKRISSYLNEMSMIAEYEYGTILSVEAPHRCTVTEKYDQIAAYWAVMPDRLRCTIDFAHVIFASAGIERVMEIVGPRLAHVHLRDAVPGNSMRGYGRGDIEFDKIFGLLNRYGYRGKCSMEFPGENDPADVAEMLGNGFAYLKAAQKKAGQEI